MKKEIKISIAGVSASGKSRIAFMIKELITELGFETELVLNEDHPTLDNFNKVMSSDIDKAVDALIEKTKVKIEEVQIQRRPDVGMGEMISFWISRHNSLDLDTPEEEIVEYYNHHHPNEGSE